jgi:hypothetical protein
MILSSSFNDAESVIVSVLKNYSDLHEVSIREALTDQLKRKDELLTQE